MSVGREAHTEARGRWLTLIVLLSGVFLGALDIAIVGPALPAIRDTFELDPRDLSWIFNAYILMGLVSAPLLAAWSDGFGRRPIYLACLLLFASGSLIVAAAPAFEVLMLGRAVQAFGAGGTLPVASAVIADVFPIERRGRALGAIGAIFGLAFILGPILGGLLLQFSWRWLFLINVPLAALVYVGASRRLPSARADDPPAADWRGAFALLTGLAALAWAMTRLDIGALRAGAWEPLPIAAIPVGLLGLWYFWRTEHKASNPMISPRLLEIRPMRAVVVLAAATGLVEASMVFLPTIAVTAFGVSASQASFMLLPLVAALIAGSMAAGRLLDAVGPRPVILTGMCLTVLGLIGFGVLPMSPANFYLAGLCIGLGLSSLLGAPLRFVALQAGGERHRGASQGLTNLVLGSGRITGAALIGGIVATGAAEAQGFRRAMVAVAVLCALSLLGSVWLRDRDLEPAGRRASGERGDGT